MLSLDWVTVEHMWPRRLDLWRIRVVSRLGYWEHVWPLGWTSGEYVWSLDWVTREHMWPLG